MDLFDHASAPLWVVDFSGVRALLEPMVHDGFDALCDRFAQDPDLTEKCCGAVQIVDANLAAQRLVGIDLEELRGPLASLIPEEGIERLAVQIAAVATGRIPFRQDVPIALDGGTRTFDLLISMVDPDDWSRVIASTLDQTDRIREVAAIRESEEKFRTLCEHAPVMIDQFAEDGSCILWNRECEKRLGWTRREIEGHDDPLSLMYPDPVEYQRALQGIMRADGRFREYRALAKNGSHRDQLWANFQLPSGTRISVGHDITELRKAQDQQRRLEDKMAQTQKLESLGVLAGGIAHDFNNLLVGVLANADLARSTDDPVLRDTLLDGIIQSARRAADLANQMLAYSGKAAMTREPTDLSALVGGLRAMIGAVVSKKAQLRYELAPRLTVDGDATQLRQVVFNLILNAAEAVGDEPGIVRVYVRRESRESIETPLLEHPLPAGDYVCFEVSDDGCGMDDETVARMFDPFFTTKSSGRGLGLASVLGIVRSHGGALEVDSEVGVGTTCRVLFPESVDAALEAQPSDATPRALGKLRVLVVDDEPMVLKTMAILLTTDGHEVVEARDGEAALRVFRENSKIDLAIVDATMPRMGGLDLIVALPPELPVVLVSGYSEKLAAGELRERVAFLQKPYSVAELHAAMQAAIDRG